MGDPRLNGKHLDFGRGTRYRASIEELRAARGAATATADPLFFAPLLPAPRVRQDRPPPGGTYTLVSLTDGRRYPLRVGINAVGRAPNNDLILTDGAISRRHCVVLVHASGGCEVHDTASLNGTLVNGHRVERVDLLPGDLLQLCNNRLVVAWVGPDGNVFTDADEPDTSPSDGRSPTI